MTKRTAIQRYLSYHGEKYIMPEKAGVLKEVMQTFKREGQAARLAFSDLAKAFQRQHPRFRLDRVSNWASQAQVGRPHFWVYLQEEGREISDPLYAFRLYGVPEEFGISVEVSIIERKKDDQSLLKQHRVLRTPAQDGCYYQYIDGDETHKLPSTEENRLHLLEQIRQGQIRKVLVKKDVPWVESQTEADLLVELEQAMQSLTPFYVQTLEAIEEDTLSI